MDLFIFNRDYLFGQFVFCIFAVEFNNPNTFMLVGGMTEAVAKWVETHDYLLCQEVQDDIITGYEADFPKYKKK